MVGSALAAKLGVNVGDSVTLDKTIAVGADDNTNGGTGKTGKSSTERNRVKVKIVGIFDSGDSDNSAIYMPSIAAQTLANLPNSIDKIEVKALTTPDNDLARKASKNPNALTQDEWETWYCTAYPSSIAYQIEEVLPGAVAKQVRQVAALQGDVLNKTQAVMVLMTVLSLVAAAIAVANLMAASIGERGSELALLKAIGATDGAVSRLMLAETAVISLVGAIAGALLARALHRSWGTWCSARASPCVRWCSCWFSCCWRSLCSWPRFRRFGRFWACVRRRCCMVGELCLAFVGGVR